MHRPPMAWLAAVGALLLVAAVVGLWATQPGLVMFPDSAPLLGTAANLADGRGLTTPVTPENSRLSPEQQVSFGAEIPISEWPPLYPAAVGAGQATGVAAATAARLLNLAALLATLALTIVICRRMGIRNRWFALAVAFLVLTGPSASPFAGGPGQWMWLALSENLFTPLVLGALLVYGLAATRPSWRLDALAVALTVLVVMTRWAGMGIGLVGAVTIVAGTATALRSRVLRAGIVLVSAPVASVAWSAVSTRLYGAGAPRALVWHPQSGQVLAISRTVCGWFFLPDDLPAVLAVAVAGLVILGPLVVVVARPHLLPAGTRPVWLSLALFPPTYLVSTVAAQTLFDAAIPLEQRILLAVQPVSYVLVCSLGALGVGRLVTRRGWTTTDAAGRALRVAGMGVGLVVAVALGRSYADHAGDARTAVENQDRDRQSSIVRDIPAGDVVFSNFPSSVWIEGGRGAYLLPQAVTFTTDEANEDFEAQVASVGDILRSRGGVVVLERESWSDFDATRATYRGLAGLVEVRACPDEDLVVLAPPSSAASAGPIARCPTPVG